MRSLDENLKGIDFAALATLRLVHRRLSFTQAATELNVKQSSVSYTIDRLRRAFSDPLFVRQGNNISATEKCNELVEATDRILVELERVALPSEFDPQTVDATVTISATYLSRSVIIPTIIRDLRQEAPGVSIEFVPGLAEASHHLRSGSADLALSPLTIDESGIYSEFLLEDPYVCLMDKANPLAKCELTNDEFANASHLIIDYGQSWQSLYHAEMLRKGTKMDVVVSTPEPEDVRMFLPGTDLIVAMPSKIAQQFANDLHVCPCPAKATTAVNLYWPARLNQSPLHTWLRGKITRFAKGL